MGGYSSTPRKAKTSEEGGVGELSYAASGMQVSGSSMAYVTWALLDYAVCKEPNNADTFPYFLVQARINMLCWKTRAHTGPAKQALIK